MTNDDKTSAGKVQYGMHRTATKISTLSLNKRDKYEYLTGEKILTLQMHMIIQEPKVIFSSLGKGFKKQKKAREKKKLKFCNF